MEFVRTVALGGTCGTDVKDSVIEVWPSMASDSDRRASADAQVQLPWSKDPSMRTSMPLG